LEVRDLERVSMSSRPHRLHHVSEVEAPALEGAVTQDGKGAEAGCEDDDPAGNERPRGGLTNV
jgi:hypothetical protein